MKHNVISRSKPLKITIRIEDAEYIAIENNLQKKKKPEKSTRFGLQSISKRYEILSRQKVKIEEGDQYFKVSIPIIR